MRSVLAVVLLALTLTGCTIEVVSSGRASDAGVPAAAESTPAPGSGSASDTDIDTQPGSTDPESRADDEQTAVSIVDEYWRRWFTAQGVRYVRPRVEGGYVGSDGPSCGGQASVPGNAFYCPAGNFLAWDENLMRAGYDQIGDAWVYLVIAHEWAHAIQAQLPGQLVSQAIELQADCLAGASIKGAADEGLVRIEPGDDEEIAQTLQAVADDFPWTDESSHGNAQQRTAAFEAGENGGVDACLQS